MVFCKLCPWWWCGPVVLDLAGRRCRYFCRFPRGVTQALPDTGGASNRKKKKKFGMAVADDVDVL